MRDAFYGHYPLSDEELGRLWLDATIVLDTNALLNLYRYSPRARGEFLEALTKVAARLWMPHHVGVEFHARRIERIREQRGIVDAILKALSEIENTTNGKLGQFSKNSLVAIDTLVERITRAIQSAGEEVSSAREDRIRSYGISVRSDPVLEQMAEIFNNNVGQGYSETEMVEIRAVADVRYGREIPPGFRDRGKDGDSKYGDFIIWRQILDLGKNSDKDVIFVTDDSKEDWWWIAKGDAVGRQILGPRPELREEFRRMTGRLFYMYSPEEFLERLYSITNGEASSELVAEVRETSYEAQLASEGDVYQQLSELHESERALSRELDASGKRIDELHSLLGSTDGAKKELAKLKEAYNSTFAMHSALAQQLRAVRESRHKHDADGEGTVADSEVERIQSALKSTEERLGELSEAVRNAEERVFDLEGSSFESIRFDLAAEQEHYSRLKRRIAEIANDLAGQGGMP